MATSSNRDVKMTLSVETLGEDGIQKLEGDIRTLAKGAGEAAPEFERLANEVGQLAAQAGAVRGLEQLASEVERLGTEQGVAAQKATELKERLEAQRAAVTQATQAQAQQAQALLEARNALTQTNAELQKLRGTTDAAGKATETYKNELAALIDRKAAEQKAIDAARVALSAANKELGDATREQTKLTGQSERAAKALTTVEKALSDQNTALAQARGAVEQYGLSADDLAGTQARLVQSLNTAGTSAQQLAQQQRQAAQANADYEASLRSVQQATEDETRAQQAFLNSFAEAQRIQQAAEYIQFWEQALQSAEAEQKQYAQDMRELETLIEQVGQAAAQEKTQVEAFNRSFDEARKAREAAEYIQFWNRSLEELERPAREAQERVRQVGEALNTLGRASVSDVQREIERVNNALETLRRESGLSGAELAQAMKTGQLRVQELQREIRELNGQLTLADRAASLFKNSLGQIAAGNLIADAVGALVERVKELGRQFVTVNVQAETVRRGLTALYGTTEIANRQFEFLRAASLRAGISMAGITDSFVRFSAATKASGIGLSETNALFEGLTRAGATLGLSTERVQLALDALGQIASKGVVSMEELRQQLGDSVPGALSLTAKGLGITDAELIKLVESGRLASRDFFPAFTKGLKELQGETNGFSATLGRLTTTLTTLAQNIGDAGAFAVLTGALKAVGVALNSVVFAFTAAYEVLTLVIKTAVAAVGALTGQGSLQESMDFLSKSAEEAAERLSRSRDAIAASIDPAGEAAQRMAALADQQERQAAAATLSAEASAQALSGYAQSADAVTQYAGAQAALSAATKALSSDSGDLSSQYVKLGVEIAKVQDSQEKEIVVRNKGVSAAKKQAEALTEIASLRENEAEQAAAAVQANNLVLEAARKEAQARESLAATLAVELSEKTKLAIQQDGSIARRKEELDAIQQRLDKATAEAEVSREEVRAIESKNAALELSRQKLVDNSDATERLRFAMNGLNVELEFAKKQFREGAITVEELAAVERRAAEAASLYVDALRDQIEKLGAVTSAKRASLDLSVAGLQVALEEARSDEARAKRIGDEAGARRALVRQKEIEIEIARLQVQIQRIEAEGSIAVAKAKLEEAKATGALTDAKRIELETEIKVAEVKLRQADARDQVIRRMVEETEALSRSKVAVDGESDAVDGNTASWNENIKAREKAIQLAKAARGEFAYDEQGFRMEADGSRSTYTVSDNNFIPDGLPNGKFNTGRLTQGQIMENIARNGGKFNPDQAYGGIGAGFNRPPKTDGAPSAAATQLEAARTELARYGVGVSDNATLQEVLRLLAEKKSAPSPTVPRTIKIEIGRSTTTVNVASDADAAALEAIFRQLETAAGRGG